MAAKKKIPTLDEIIKEYPPSKEKIVLQITEEEEEDLEDLYPLEEWEKEADESEETEKD